MDTMRLICYALWILFLTVTLTLDFEMNNRNFWTVIKIPCLMWWVAMLVFELKVGGTFR